MNQYNVAIIGGGPGGYVAAIRSAQLSLKTVVIEEVKLGGTCLNIGCIPTKTLVKNAEMLYELKHASGRGIKVGKPEIDMPEMMAMKNKVVAQLTGGIQFLLNRNGVTVVKGKAAVVSEHMLAVNGEEITFDNLIIATGSSNFIPPVPGLEEGGILTSTELLDIDHVPERLAIIGGGVIGCEFASIFNELGSKVTIIEMMPNIVPAMDADISAALRTSMTAKGIDVKAGYKVTEVRNSGNGYEVAAQGNTEDTIHADKVLVSVGRKSNLDGVDALGLELERNYIKVNERMETSIKNIYAAGDVTGKIQLAHVASAQGVAAAENIAGGNSAMSYEVIPNCIFTLPEIGSAGMTELKAKETYGEIIVGKFPFSACGKALASGAPEGFVKVIADKRTNKLVGCHIIGQTAAELISEASVVMQSGGKITDIADTIHAHPTISEAVCEAALAALDKPVHTVKL